MFFRPGRDSLRFLPSFPSSELNCWAKVSRPPGWADPAVQNFCVNLDFCITNRCRETSIINSAAAGGGGRDDMLGRTNETSPSSLLHGHEPRRGRRVKQSQLAPDGPGRPSPRPEALTLPPVVLSNRAKQSQFAPRRAILPRRRGTCETNPISGRCQRAKQSQLLRSARKWARAGSVGRLPEEIDCAKRSQFGPARGKAGALAGEMCKTNPIGPGTSRPRAAKCSERSQSGPCRAVLSRRHEMCETKPILRRGLLCETEPISRLRIADFRNGTGQLASAFGEVVGLRTEDRLPPGRPILRNEPNLACRLGAAQNKMSKTNPISGGPRYPGIPLFHHSSPKAVVRNKANFPAGGALPTVPVFHYSNSPSFPSAWTRGMDCANNGRFVGWVFLIL